jgi:hypothetical protein
MVLWLGINIEGTYDKESPLLTSISFSQSFLYTHR